MTHVRHIDICVEQMFCWLGCCLIQTNVKFCVIDRDTLACYNPGKTRELSTLYQILIVSRWIANQAMVCELNTVTILLLTFPHLFSSYTLCMLLPHAYYFLFTFLFPSTDFLFFHAQPYCLCVASCTVWLLMHSPAQFCTVCLLMHSLLRHSLVTQYIRTG